MQELGSIVGWVLYLLTVLFALSGLLSVSKAARTGGSITHMGLFQMGLAVVCALVFGFTDLNKLHLLWITPVGFVISFTPIGRALGYLIGRAFVARGP